MKTKNLIAEKISSLIYAASILIFIIAFNFSDNPPSGWTQQFFPDLNGKTLMDITFTDSLTGYAVTGDNSTVLDSNYILKTTNGGDNWNIILTEYKNYTNVEFLNENTGYVCGGQDLAGYLIKTTNKGINWNQVTGSAFGTKFDDMSVLNEDTIWVADKNGFNGGIFRSTNRGISWVRQLESSSGLDKIYMYNKDIGFANTTTSTFFFKTTNSGVNWNVIQGQNGFNDIYFIDSLTGWKSYDSMRITTDGGITWKRQYIPYGGNISFQSGVFNFVNINSDSIWGAGGAIFYGINNYRGFLYMTTDKGYNWSYQIPDTSFSIPYYQFIDFTNKNIGWAYTPVINQGIHTIVGGDTTFLTNIISSSNIKNSDYRLYQNYPNPFNPKTKILYELKQKAEVTIKVFDILGNEIQTLVKANSPSGNYEVEFDGSGYSSGIYFYRMEVKTNKEIYKDSGKMILLK